MSIIKHVPGFESLADYIHHASKGTQALVTIPSHQTKMLKSRKVGVYSTVLHLAPADSAQPYVTAPVNLCPGSSAGCRSSCLYKEGRARFTPEVNLGRFRRTLWFLGDRDSFMAQYVRELETGNRAAQRNGMRHAHRPDGTSDVLWEGIPVTRNGVRYPNLMAAFPEIQFYGYTKLLKRLKNPPANLSFTFSLSEENLPDAVQAFRMGYNVAVVFKAKANQPIPERFHLPSIGWIPVIDGDQHDARFLDPQGVIVGLRAKGRSYHDTSGFVILPDFSYTESQLPIAA